MTRYDSTGAVDAGTWAHPSATGLYAAIVTALYRRERARAEWFHLEGVNKIPAKRAPSIGQHSDEILRGEGYSADEIGWLRKSGVVA